jgi:hypothetical protein
MRSEVTLRVASFSELDPAAMRLPDADVLGDAEALDGDIDEFVAVFDTVPVTVTL